MGVDKTESKLKFWAFWFVGLYLFSTIDGSKLEVSDVCALYWSLCVSIGRVTRSFDMHGGMKFPSTTWPFMLTMLGEKYWSLWLSWFKSWLLGTLVGMEVQFGSWWWRVWFIGFIWLLKNKSWFSWLEDVANRVASLRTSGFTSVWRFKRFERFSWAELSMEERSMSSKRGLWVTGSIPFLSSLLRMWVFQ